MDHGRVHESGAPALFRFLFAQLRPITHPARKRLLPPCSGLPVGQTTSSSFCLQTPSQISVRVEVPRSQGGGLLVWLRGRFRYEEVLTSRSDIAQRVEQYFTLTPEQFQGQLSR